jgi:hypothetical protein
MASEPVISKLCRYPLWSFGYSLQLLTPFGSENRKGRLTTIDLSWCSFLLLVVVFISSMLNFSWVKLFLLNLIWFDMCWIAVWFASYCFSVLLPVVVSSLVVLSLLVYFSGSVSLFFFLSVEIYRSQSFRIRICCARGFGMVLNLF